MNHSARKLLVWALVRCYCAGVGNEFRLRLLINGVYFWLAMFLLQPLFSLSLIPVKFSFSSRRVRLGYFWNVFLHLAQSLGQQRRHVDATVRRSVRENFPCGHCTAPQSRNVPASGGVFGAHWNLSHTFHVKASTDPEFYSRPALQS